MRYAIEFRPSVLNDLKRVPKKDLIRIKSRIKELSSNLPPSSTTKMKGYNPFHRIRSGDYRIIYEIREETIVILIVRIGHRKDVYKKLL